MLECLCKPYFDYGCIDMFKCSGSVLPSSFSWQKNLLEMSEHIFDAEPLKSRVCSADSQQPVGPCPHISACSAVFPEADSSSVQGSLDCLTQPVQSQSVSDCEMGRLCSLFMELAALEGEGGGGQNPAPTCPPEHLCAVWSFLLFVFWGDCRAQEAPGGRDWEQRILGCWRIILQLLSEESFFHSVSQEKFS